jgi:hypothetical protein
VKAERKESRNTWRKSGGKKGRERHACTQHAPGEKGGFERGTRGMCVCKIVTETREEKKEKPSGVARSTGWNGSPAWAKEEGEGVRARAALYSTGGRSSLRLARRRKPHQVAPPRLANPRTSHRKSQRRRRRWKQERTTSARRLCTFTFLPV